MNWYRELETYTREHGNTHVPRTHANTKLASWVWIQRQRRKGTYNRKGNLDLLTAEQTSLLDKLGFRWDPHDEKWAELFEQLKRFMEQHGHCEVGQVEGEQNELSRWVSSQRNHNSSAKLQAERKAKLDSIGFKWNSESNDRNWREMCEQLRTYHAEHGDADVPFRSKENRKLAAWVSHQRQRKKSGSLEDEEIRLLDAIGFTWQHRERGSWDDRLDEVAAFKAKHGHCAMPVSCPENPKLGRFVNTMRTQRNNGSLSVDRIAKLDALGFVWASSRKVLVDGDGITAEWQARFDKLFRYKETHGDCDVPAKWRENPQLGNWVSQQRQSRKNGTLHPERVRRLDEIGFDWRSDSRQEEWATRLEQLRAYKKRFSNCRVPVKWKEDPQLGAWVSNQRYRLKSGTLSPEKKRLLTEIGFD